VRISKRRKPRDVKEQELTRVVPDGDARSRRLWAIQALLPVALEEFVKEMHREFEELTGPAGESDRCRLELPATSERRAFPIAFPMSSPEAD
jgi:hypothetical protein